MVETKLTRKHFYPERGVNPESDETITFVDFHEDLRRMQPKKTFG